MLPIRVYPHGLLLLSPLICAVTVVILLALLSIFVTSHQNRFHPPSILFV